MWVEKMAFILLLSPVANVLYFMFGLSVSLRSVSLFLMQNQTYTLTISCEKAEYLFHSHFLTHTKSHKDKSRGVSESRHADGGSSSVQHIMEQLALLTFQCQSFSSLTVSDSLI